MYKDTTILHSDKQSNEVENQLETLQPTTFHHHLLCVCVRHSFSNSLAFIIAGPGTNGVNMAPVLLHLWVNLNIHTHA